MLNVLVVWNVLRIARAGGSSLHDTSHIICWKNLPKHVISWEFDT